jgi:hypothetical protein
MTLEFNDSEYQTLMMAMTNRREKINKMIAKLSEFKFEVYNQERIDNYKLELYIVKGMENKIKAEFIKLVANTDWK